MSDSAQFIIELEAQMKGLSGAVEDLNKLTDSLQALNKGTKTGEESLKKTSAHIDELGKSSKKAGGLTGFFANTHIFALRRAMEHLGGPFGGAIAHVFRFGEGLHKMAKQGGTLGLMTGGALLAVGVLGSLGAKLLEGAAAALKFGVAMADAGRDQELTLQGMLGSEKAGTDLAESFSGIGKATGATSERMMSLAGELADAHLSATDMATAIGAITEQEQAIGTGKTAQLIAQLKAGTTSANALANSVDKKFGGIVKSKMLGLSQQFEVLKTEAADTFGGLKIEGFLTGLQHLIGMLDQSTASGKALKFLFEKVFQPLLDAATETFPYIELFVLRFINTILKLYIQTKPTIDKLMKALGMKPGDAIQVVLTLATIAAYVFAAAVATVVGSIMVAIAIFEGIRAAISAVTPVLESLGQAEMVFADSATSALSDAVDEISDAFNGIPDDIQSAIDFVEGLPDKFSAAGEAIIDGLVNAIKNGASKVIAAVTNLGHDAVKAAKDVFQIHSPSKLFYHEIGEQNVEGLAQAHEDGAPRIKSSIESMSELPSSSPLRAGRAGRVGGGGIHFHGNIIINAKGDKAKDIRNEIEDFFEEKAIELGSSSEATS